MLSQKLSSFVTLKFCFRSHVITLSLSASINSQFIVKEEKNTWNCHSFFCFTPFFLWDKFDNF